MVLGWRRAFCTSIPREGDSIAVASTEEHDLDHGIDNCSSNVTPRFGGRFGFFSSSSDPSTPRVRSQSVSSPNLRCRTTATVPAASPSVPVSPKLQCKTKNSPRCFLRSSNPSSPRSPSTFSFIKSSLRLSTIRCGLCLQSVKRGQGMAIFTAECSHSFHFPCVSDHVKKQGSLACPVCSCLWKEMPLFSVDDLNRNQQFVEEEEKTREKLATRFMDEVVGKKESPKPQSVRYDLKVYNDDESLVSLTPKARFNPIPESDENCDEDCIGEFQGFHVNGDKNSAIDDHARDVEVRLLPEAAVISVSRRHETYAIVLKVKAPPAPENTQRRAPIDLVTVVDVSGKITIEKLQMIKRAMRLIVSALSPSDRLSIVAFSTYSKRLLPLRRMTTSGRRSARRIVEAMAVLGGSSNAKDAVKKAVKVLEDRREKNAVSSIILLSDIHDQSSTVSSTRYSHSHLDVPIHSLKLAVTEDHTLAKFMGNILNVVVQDLKLHLGFISGSSPATITAVYSHKPHAAVHTSGTVRIGELVADEETELLVELKVPLPALRPHHVLSVRCCYRESVTQEIIYTTEQALPVPRPPTVGSSSPAIQRLRNLFLTTRALAVSRQLVRQPNPLQPNPVQANPVEKCEPLTPTSAWRVADKLAKVAMMRKSLNRVSDLHGFEDARF